MPIRRALRYGQFVFVPETLQREVPAVGSNLGFLQFEAELPEPNPYRPFPHGAVRGDPFADTF